MITVVLDTNVIISGTYWSGDSFKILQLLENGKIKSLFLSHANLYLNQNQLHAYGPSNTIKIISFSNTLSLAAVGTSSTKIISGLLSPFTSPIATPFG